MKIYPPTKKGSEEMLDDLIENEIKEMQLMDAQDQLAKKTIDEPEELDNLDKRIEANNVIKHGV